MYKNFKITEEEKKQILESHMSHGYKKPLNEDDSSKKTIEILWEKISEMSKDYYDAMTNLDDVGCNDSETYAEYYHSSGQMEPGGRDDYDDNDDHDNGYSYSQQTSIDRNDYANSAEDPITRSERRMGA